MVLMQSSSSLVYPMVDWTVLQIRYVQLCLVAQLDDDHEKFSPASEGSGQSFFKRGAGYFLHCGW